jgi:hypothetical protein
VGRNGIGLIRVSVRGGRWSKSDSGSTAVARCSKGIATSEPGNLGGQALISFGIT